MTQRGNRRQQTFFYDDDYRAYMELMSERCVKFEVEIWCYCLMPNHVHLIGVPSAVDSLRQAIGDVHKRYTRRINDRQGWRGYLWQGRFSSFPMDEPYLLAAARYIEQNPVRAKLVRCAEDYLWSSAGAHMRGHDKTLVKVSPLLGSVGDWQAFLSSGYEPQFDEVRKRERTGRPLRGEDFVRKVSHLLGRDLAFKKRGRKAKGNRYCVPEIRIITH